jgi:hypothetical protein
VNGFHVIAVGVQDEGPVVARRVFGTDAGRAIVTSAGGDRGRVELVDLLRRVGGEGNMNRRSGGVGERDREVIEALGAEGHVTTVVAFIELDEAQRRQRASVERAIAFEVCDTDREVIDDDATDWDAVRLHVTRSKASVPHHVRIWRRRRAPRQLARRPRLPLRRRRAAGPQRRQ